MRIQLIFPPFVSGTMYPPLGLAYIGAVLEKDGHQVNILDASALRLSWSDTLRKIKSFTPDIIGITTNTPFFDKVKKLSYLIKDEMPDVPLLVGGPHATCLPKETLRETKADIAIIGEGERTIVELVNAIQENSSLGVVKGIAFKMVNDVFVTERRKLIEDLDSLPFPARHLLPMNAYQRGITSAIASRGCPFNCLFCSVRTIWGRSYRIRSPENVVRELVEIYERFKIRRIFFQDDEFTLNKKWVSRFCDELGKVKIDFKWICLSRVDLVDEEILLKMRRAGCYQINFGVESGNDAILTAIRKKVSASQVIRAFDFAAKMGIERQAYFMIGNIGENIQTVADTIRLAKKINPEHIFFSIASPLPGTDFYQLAKSENLIVTDNRDELDYYGGHVAIKTKELSSSDILQLQKIAFAEFFARRRYLNENIIRRIFNKAFLYNYGCRELIQTFSRFLLAYPRKFHYRKVWFDLYKKLSNYLD